MIHDPLDDSMNTQFELSYDLLHFLRWLLEHENEHKGLKASIQRALIAGFKSTPSSSRRRENDEDMQNLQYSVVEFFALLDTLLYEAMHENTIEKSVQKNLTQTIQQIDGMLCDDSTLHTTIEKTTEEMDRHPKKSPKKVLCETLLRQWRPAKGNEIH